VMARLVGARPHGLIVLPDPTTNTRRKLIVELAARHRLPAYPCIALRRHRRRLDVLRH
jgi:hypothetical protein